MYCYPSQVFKVSVDNKSNAETEEEKKESHLKCIQLRGQLEKLISLAVKINSTFTKGILLLLTAQTFMHRNRPL